VLDLFSEAVEAYEGVTGTGAIAGPQPNLRVVLGNIYRKVPTQSRDTGAITCAKQAGLVVRSLFQYDMTRIARPSVDWGIIIGRYCRSGMLPAGA
jgi:hypothetical protein